MRKPEQTNKASTADLYLPIEKSFFYQPEVTVPRQFHN